MNLEEQRIIGNNQIHIIDALNAALLEIKLKRENFTLPVGINQMKIYVDKQDKSNPTDERREYIFTMREQLNFYAASVTREDSDKFIMKLVVENGDVVMKTYVERCIGYDAGGNKGFLTEIEIEEIDSMPIVLFEGENYIYTNYDQMYIELVYPKDTIENRTYLNNAIYYTHRYNTKNGEFSLDDIYFKDAFTKIENKLNLEVDNAKVACITSKNNKFSLDEEGNLTVNSVLFNNTNFDFNLLSMYPVGSIYMSVNDTNPNEHFGGTWVQIKDKFLLACGDTYQNNITGGESEHILTINEMPQHNHQAHFSSGLGPYASFPLGSGDNPYWGPSSNTIGNTGGGNPHNNMPPYLTVYVWKRIA